MRFFLLVYQYCPDEVSELTNTFLAKDGIGFAAELDGVRHWASAPSRRHTPRDVPQNPASPTVPSLPFPHCPPQAKNQPRSASDGHMKK